MATQRRERKVVTVVFCDLVGFTSRAEALDPEDVEAILRPYHERVRHELERHGGTVEKFIGDAVMALFGAPIAHEDDPERAVRAALAIRGFALEDGLELRVGITTGEALVSLDADPAGGEGMASGDVVNTAARLQSAAPVNGILVDETTYRATRQAVEYEKVAPVEAKGKAQPVPVWCALEARARFGVDVAHEARSELVGRERDLDVLRDAFARARHERTPQLVTLVGVPGIGKSRLVHELWKIVDTDPELVTWRQGRCLAYGDGVTLWALSEIVKAQAGIVEQDATDEVAEKLRRMVEDLLAGTGDEGRVESQLQALVGLAGESELGGDRRGVAFAAWRRALEAMAEQRPLVLVFEDLHWADESLLDFVDELVDWVTDVPLLVVGTARPELLERRPAWGGGKLNATTIALAPLSEEQTSRLLAQLLERPLLAADSQQALLERAGGNPLYAEQFAELYLEQGRADELRLPETLHGIIAARLDGLSGAEKELLQDASVIGKVFWASAVARNGDDVSAALHALERKGFVRRQKRSSVEGESEFAFAHALVRDVAYGQIARADRAAKHRRAAEWIESLGRPDDHAEMLAHHWRAALELARASATDDAVLAERARRALRDAGDRAYGLNAFPAAERYYGQALELWPTSDSEHPELLFRRARALHLAADDRREDALVHARDALLAAGRQEEAAEAEAYRSQALWYRGRRDESEASLARAQELAVGLGDSPAKARVLAFSARFTALAGDDERAVPIAEETLRLAERLGLRELQAHALTTIGTARRDADPDRARRDLEAALAIALEANSPIASTIVNNVGVLAFMRGDAERALALYEEAGVVAERVGDRAGERWSRGNRAGTALLCGRWDEAERLADAFIAECERSPHYLEHSARETRAFIRAGRGDVAGAIEDYRRSVEHARDVKDPQATLPALAHAARGFLKLGRETDAQSFADEAVAIARRFPNTSIGLGIAVAHFDDLGIGEAVRELVREARPSPWRTAVMAAAKGRLDEAAEGFAEMGARTPSTEAWQAHARRLLAEGRMREADSVLRDVIAFYERVGATYFADSARALLPTARDAYSDSA
ncbi:MAG TPA: AAA family ATPase [Gaiellaceae bacterium]|nr:AAA family ATPase [Gaiellaceae bacterium]